MLAGGLVLLLSIGFATTAGWLTGSRTTGGGLQLRQGNVWVRAFTRRQEGRRPYLAVELDDGVRGHDTSTWPLTDGRLVEGYLLYCSTDTDPQRRDLALQGPLAGSRPAGDRIRLPAATIVIPAGRIRLVHVSYPAERRRTSPTTDPAGTTASGGTAPNPGQPTPAAG